MNFNQSAFPKKLLGKKALLKYMYDMGLGIVMPVTI